MKTYGRLAFDICKARWMLLLATSVGFVVLYYFMLLLLTMLRFGEIPNYFVFHDVIGVYQLIYEGTPSIIDMIPIIIDEAWFEAGYKNPDYYGVATWSYMLIPPKMILLLFMGILLGIFTALVVHGRSNHCETKQDRHLYVAAGVGSTFIGLTSATLTWVVCCSTPSWVVALAMLGMSGSLALWLEPLGNVLTISGLFLMLWIIYQKLKMLSKTEMTIG